MSFNESQQKIIEYVKTDSSISKDFFEAEKTISKFDSTISQDVKDKELWKIVSEYYTTAVKKNDTEALALQNTRSDITGVDLSIFNTTIESKEKINNSYTFLDIIQKNPTVYNTIKSYIKAPETIEHRSQSIENIRWEFALWSLDQNIELKNKIQQQPQIKQNIKTGLSLYFTDWLNNLSTSDLKQVVDIGWIGKLIGKASDLMGMFGKLTSFKDQMRSINTVVDGMDIHSNDLISSASGKTIESLTAFQSPEWFVRLLKKHTTSVTTTQSESGPKSFEDYFSLETSSQVDVNTIVAWLEKSYTADTHTLMNKVLTMWPNILEHRTQLQNTFASVYDQLSQVVSLFSEGKTLSEYVEGTWMGNLANFVGAILGVGSLKQYERKQQIKELTQKCPEQQKNWVQHALAYIAKYNTEQTYITTNNSFSKLFEKIDNKVFEEQKTTKESVIQSLPNEHLLKDSFQSAVETTGFFVHPKILLSAGITNWANYIQWDGEKKPYTIKENKKDAYNKILLDNKDKICNIGRTPLLQPTLIADMVAAWKNKQHISGLLLSGLSFPDYAIGLVKNDALSDNAIESVTKLVWYGAQQTQQLEQSTNENKIEENSNSKTKTENENTWEIKTELINKVDNIFKKYAKENVPVEAETFISLMKKKWIPLELWLAQAIIESNLWTSWWRPTKTKNMFNVGNIDNWSNKYMNTREEWIEKYTTLIKEKYSNENWLVITQDLLNNWFKNKDWNKYATDSEYTNKLSNIIKDIKEVIV